MLFTHSGDSSLSFSSWRFLSWASHLSIPTKGKLSQYFFLFLIFSWLQLILVFLEGLESVSWLVVSCVKVCGYLSFHAGVFLVADTAPQVVGKFNILFRTLFDFNPSYHCKLIVFFLRRAGPGRLFAIYSPNIVTGGGTLFFAVRII